MISAAVTITAVVLTHVSIRRQCRAILAREGIR